MGICRCDFLVEGDFDPQYLTASVQLDAELAIVDICDFTCNNCGGYVDHIDKERVYLAIEKRG